MLYAKISPAAQIVKQDGPFSSTVIEAEYILVNARNYVLGEGQTVFNVSFGTPSYFPNGGFQGFKTELTNSTTLTSTELANWGTDDSIIFPLIAAKQGFTIVEILDSEANSGN